MLLHVLRLTGTDRMLWTAQNLRAELISEQIETANGVKGGGPARKGGRKPSGKPTAKGRTA